MFIGYNFFGLDHSAVFNNLIQHLSYSKTEFYQGLINEIYFDENLTFAFSTTFPGAWQYSTLLNAKFQDNLEAGSLTANGLMVDTILLQKRKWNELQWTDAGEISYSPNQQLLYELIDTIVANDEIYQYSLIPVAEGVRGERILSEEVTVDFEGIFLSDRNNNYRLIYDLELSPITHNSPSNKFEPLDGIYPTIVYSNLDYSEFDIQATFITATTHLNQGTKQTSIRTEKLERDTLMRFIKNKKPKIYRDMNGQLKIVSIVDNPVETPTEFNLGISKVSFKMVEVGAVDTETLRATDLLELAGA